MKLTTSVICSLLFLNSSFLYFGPDFLDWDSNHKLTFSDFKAIAPNGSANVTVSLATSLSYEIKQVKGEIPTIQILNRIDRNSSWIKVKKQEVLDLQQIQFDISELYARKIRKEIKTLNAKKVTDKSIYLSVITKFNSKCLQIQRKNNISLDDQPELIKVLQKDISDSLNLYKEYIK